jgi:hypothetical protein
MMGLPAGISEGFQIIAERNIIFNLLGMLLSTDDPAQAAGVTNLWAFPTR